MRLPDLADFALLIQPRFLQRRILGAWPALRPIYYRRDFLSGRASWKAGQGCALC